MPPRRLSDSRRTRAKGFTIDDERLLVLVAPLAAANDPRLAPAEREVAALILEGKSNAEIATARGTSVRTVANQVRSAMNKIGVQSRAELVVALLA